MKHKIHSSLESLAVEIASLTPDPRNARAHDERNLEAVIASFTDHGQVKPIVVQRLTDKGQPMVIRAGNASTDAAKALGWTHIAAVILDVDDKDAKKYALRDNRTADLAEWDLPNLGAEMRELADAGVDVSTLVWQSYEYEPLMQAEWKPPENSGESFDAPGRGHSLKFTADEWSRAVAACGGKKPTAEQIINALTGS